jgi:hypothetical protein
MENRVQSSRTALAGSTAGAIHFAFYSCSGAPNKTALKEWTPSDEAVK